MTQGGAVAKIPVMTSSPKPAAPTHLSNSQDPGDRVTGAEDTPPASRQKPPRSLQGVPGAARPPWQLAIFLPGRKA